MVSRAGAWRRSGRRRQHDQAWAPDAWAGGRASPRRSACEQHGHDPEMRRGQSPRRGQVSPFAAMPLKPIDEPATVTKVPVSMGGRRGIGGSRPRQAVAVLEPGHHHLDGDHGIVDQQAEREIRRRAICAAVMPKYAGRRRRVPARAGSKSTRQAQPAGPGSRS